MPENVSPPHESHKDSRLFGKSKWRGKLFSSEGRFGRGAESQNDDEDGIAQFLKPSATSPESRPKQVLQAPRLDTAKASRVPSEPPISGSSAIQDTYRGPKPRMNKGLRVKFAVTKPVVIGEGGDTAQLPSKDVLHSLITPDASIPFRPAPLQRKSTGLDESTAPIKPNNGHAHDVNIASANQYDISSALPVARKPLAQSQIYISDDDMYKSSVDENVSPVSPESSNSDTEIGGRNQINNSGRAFAYSSPDAPSPERVTGNILAPVPSLQPPSGFRRDPSIDHAFPDARSTSSSPPKLCDVKERDSMAHTADFRATKETKSLSLRGVAKNLAHDALDEFDIRVRKTCETFHLRVSSHRDIMEISFSQWIRTSAWWFLKGRAELENAVRGGQQRVQDSDHTHDTDTAKGLMQAYINLAKAWWIIRDITPNHPDVMPFGKASMSSKVAIMKSFGDRDLATLVEIHVGLVANMRALTMSMKRNNRLPPQSFEIQGFSFPILIESPILPSKVAHLVSNLEHISSNDGSFFPLLLGDTERHFSFGRMFVQSCLRSRRNHADNLVCMPCILSVLRERRHWDLKATITSQDGQINFIIQSDESQVANMTWKDVHWDVSAHAMWLTLSADLDLHVEFSEKDFKTLWGICDYNQKTWKDFGGHKDEKIVFDCMSREFERLEKGSEPDFFPSGSVSDSDIRVFERRSTRDEGTVQRIVHHDIRLMVITPPGIKSLSSIGFSLAADMPNFVALYRHEMGPALTLQVPTIGKVLLGFHNMEELERFRSSINGTLMREDEYSPAPLPLRGLSVTASAIDPDQSNQYARSIAGFRWRQLRIIKRGPPGYDDSLSTIRSETLRIVSDCDLGSFVDYLNLGARDLRMALSVEDFNEMRLFRPPQADMVWTLLDNKLSGEAAGSLSNTLRQIRDSSTIRTYCFCSLSDLHSFQAMVTGFSVLYDGYVANLAISRRRMVVPVYKRWEASCVRLQVVRQDKLVQMVAFFKDFHHGTCMNFVLKETDVFEISGRSGGFILRMVDAKFALPKGEENMGKDFVCLDEPEYPSEHDDITITFDNEDERARFASQLPAAANKASRMGSLRR